MTNLGDYEAYRLEGCNDLMVNITGLGKSLETLTSELADMVTFESAEYVLDDLEGEEWLVLIGATS